MKLSPPPVMIKNGIRGVIKYQKEEEEQFFI
jgi:hypothetical protein